MHSVSANYTLPTVLKTLQPAPPLGKSSKRQSHHRPDHGNDFQQQHVQ